MQDAEPGARGRGVVIAGLPVGTWALTAFAVVPGIVLVVAAYRVHRRGDARDAAQRPDGGDAGGTRPQPDPGAPPQAIRRGDAGRG